ncbi:acid phosphatase (class A) [Rhodoblastus sphagnicola]|uniref:phosphatase PAP2 family protein n=1 Tax=Rhodoblastus sphagnicola TaxID=333368 RepID=UPI001855CF38|nr:acid phosphatase (class A) [Rhodoblastus sphagnicola]
MKSAVHGAVVLYVALALTPAAFAHDAAFVAPEQSEAILILPDPPAEGSDAQKADLARLHEIELTRTPQQVEVARADGANQTIFLFQNLFGEMFTQASLPLTAALGARVVADADANADAAKDLFQRKRPFVADPTLRPACPASSRSNSYPSGHAMVGWLLGLTLVEMVPERRAEILARAADYGRARNICGAHYPSDVEASRALAYAVHGVMARNPAYRAELAAARAELRKALNLPDAP